MPAGSQTPKSSTSDTSTMNGENGSNNICRDYLRNVCNRGNSCKFRHPEGEEAKALGKKDLIFCHDFQNKECRRVNCRFIHCTKQEEEMYRTSGFISEQILESAAQKGGSQLLPSIPVCKDFLKGECKRGGRCKFRHISSGLFHMENNNLGPLQPPRRGPFENFERAPFDGFGVCEPQPKRQAYEDHFTPFNSGNGVPDSHQLLSHCRLLQDENARLLHKVEELKKQIVDLTATNDFLRDQNEQMRGLAGKDWYMSPYQNSYLS
ncbi:zinc finger CCCH domain-containing protein 10 [Parasteatoda tepidariorum]|uniref:zinc finger CCCH domain-containing protein 10 n=1 Tax=Parasteatoda tepidariorum TaxID=114398 RepID=UPI00077F90B2|nr:zinc finger CCCH domain-containing protein 10 [Parasteatoda tepidariorum]